MHPGNALASEVELDVDLDVTPHCEVRKDAEAVWHLFGACPGCNTTRHALVCDGCRALLTGQKGTRCGRCNFSGPSKKFFTRALRL